MNSATIQIRPTPEEKLLDAVSTNNLDKIEQLVTRNKYLLCHTYAENKNKTILLIACSEDGVKAETVKKLLDLGANPRDYSNEGREAIHWAAFKTNSEVLQILLQRVPEDVNVQDLLGNTPLLILIHYGAKESRYFLECAKLLIGKGANVKLTDSNHKDALYWAADRGCLEQIQIIINESQKNEMIPENPGEKLYSYLQQGDESEFISYNNGDIEQWVNYENGYTLLQLSCENSLNRAALHLLSKGADYEKIGSCHNKKPIVIAAERGNQEIFSSLLDKYPNLTSIPEGLLPITLKYTYRPGFKVCYQMYMDKIQTGDLDEKSLKVNEKDRNGNTALKYAIKYCNSEIVHELLDQGASLGAKDQYDSMPIYDINPELLEQHLDNCIKIDSQNNFEVENNDLKIFLNFRTLIPPYARQAENTSLITKDLVKETEVLIFMANSSEYRHLLSHPIMVCFLLIKWLKIRRLFWTSFYHYLAFAVSLVTYVLLDCAYFPVEEKPTIILIISALSYICLVLTFIILLAKELFQIFVSQKEHFKHFQNYIEVILVLLTFFIVFIPNSSLNIRKQISSLGILLVALELVLLVGPHPYVSTYVMMLKKVSYNYFKCFISYCYLLIAFAFSFYLLFSFSVPNLLTVSQNQTAADNSDKSFDNPLRSIFKTIIMLTGELDSSSLDFDTFPVTSQLIFVIFIFMISIILSNLLNGLAVSDTQMIKNEAELVSQIVRAQYINHVENMFLDNDLRINILRRITDYFSCSLFRSSWCRTILKIVFPKTYVFPKHFNYEMVLVDVCNQGQRKVNVGRLLSSSIKIDHQTLRKIRDMAQKKNERNPNDVILKLEIEISKIKRKTNIIERILKKNNAENTI